MNYAERLDCQKRATTRKRNCCMKKTLILSIVLLVTVNVRGQELAFETLKLDTSVYSQYYHAHVLKNINDALHYEPLINLQGLGTFLSGIYFNKKTSQYDVFIQNVKTVSISAPTFSPDTEGVGLTLVTQSVFNADDDWEVLWELNGKWVISTSNGDIIWTTLEDEKPGYIYFDGTYIYCSVDVYNGSTYVNSRYYRFNPGGTGSNNNLAKSKASPQAPVPLLSFGATGDYRIKLSKSPAGATTVSLFNLAGQQLFTKTIADPDRDVSFTIPSHSVPGSPFITRVENDFGVSNSKSLPVK